MPQRLGNNESGCGELIHEVTCSSLAEMVTLCSLIRVAEFFGGWGILVGGISGVIGNVEVDLAPPARRWRALATVNGGDENR